MVGAEGVGGGEVDYADGGWVGWCAVGLVVDVGILSVRVWVWVWVGG